jgi:hypothetical protein
VGFEPDQNLLLFWALRGKRKPRGRAKRTSPDLDMPDIPIHELEAAINFWRNRSPSSGDEMSLCKEASALSRPYALLIVQRQSSVPTQQLDEDARLAWQAYADFKNGLQA